MSSTSGEHVDAAYVRVRRRSRRSSRRRTVRRNRLLLRRAALVLAAVSVVAVPAAVIGGDLLAARRALIGADAELRDARSALREGDLVRATGAVRSADLLVAPLPARLDRPVWRLAARTPVLGRPLRLARAIVDTASAGTTLARLAIDEDLGILLEGLRPRFDDGRIALTPVLDAAARLDRLDTSRLRASLVTLEAAGAGVSDERLLDTRRSMLELGDELATTVERTRTLTAVLPGLLGADAPRTYLVVLQTSAELRGTGGLYGSFTLLDLDSGRVTLRPVTARPASATAATTGAAVAVPAAFAQRYGRLDADRTFSNVNLDPDLATSARVTLDLFALREGSAVDGLILFDPFGLQALLEALDLTLVLPAELIAGTDAPATLPAADFARFVTVDVYDAFGEARGVERDRLTEQLGDQALAAVFGRDWDAARLAPALADATAGRHLQVFSREPLEQAALATTPAGGDLAGVLADPRRDVIALTHNNAVGGKQDVHLGHRTSIGIELVAPRAAELRTAQGTVELERRLVIDTTVTNTLAPGAFDRYITGNCLVGGTRSGCFLGPEAHNRSWITFWLDPAIGVTRVSDGTGLPDVAQGRMHDAATYDVFVEVPPLEGRGVRLEGAGTHTLTLGPDGSLGYELLLWRQAKGVPDVLEVNVTAPEGYEVADARLVAGRLGVALAGPDAAVRPARLRLRSDGVSVSGAVGTDVILRVRFAPVRPS